ncbi:lipoic acid synthetase [Ereboglobus sp. PH5-5]|uniref:lipoyl synthase n=1 Tax=Ereboglobus sp. PH5-5 TaxID=2940529 RepID=UPI002405C76B|nr:lipoyl synthase [Ereboglobus sp. PH5-5]MDF9834292.1 lipoic acid synthetase [Ereboglobus sp. PH5-5]
MANAPARDPAHADTSRKPSWLRAKLPSGSGYNAVRKLVDGHHLHSVCQSAQCPNLGECWTRGTATVMILGNICTRSCNFCAIATGRPTELDLGEPARVADAVAKMGLRHCVITSVARDELLDGGASVWAATIRAIRHANPKTAIEVLVPDFKGKMEHVDIVLEARPDIFNHNLETVERLQKPVRVQARYDRSRSVLRHAKSRGLTTKTGIMLGLGEEPGEIEQTLRDIVSDGTDIVTIGQYLQPTPQHWPVKRWVPPAEFEYWKKFGLSIGLGVVESGPLVRSSYHADEQSEKYTGADHLNTENNLTSEKTRPAS